MTIRAGQSIATSAAVTVVALVCAPGCAGGYSQPSDALITGRWAGDRIELVLNEMGGSVEFDCARGVILEPIQPRDDGRFDVPGSYSGLTRRPERIDETSAQAQTSRYEGTVSGDEMTITLRLTDSGQTLGPYSASRNGRSQLVKCG